jgi:hypothetical protein
MRGKETLARQFRPRDWHEQDGKILLEKRTVLDDWRRIRSRWILIDGDHRFERIFTPRVHAASEIASLALGCGFRTVKIFGDRTGVAYDQNANWLVVVAATQGVAATEQAASPAIPRSS